MIRQRLERSLVRKLHDAGTRCPSRWVSNVLSQFVPQEIAQTRGSFLDRGPVHLGVALLVRGRQLRDRRLSVAPAAGPRSAGLTLGGRF